MSTLTTTRTYADGDDLTEAELDSAFDSIETWANGNIGTANIATSGVDTTQLAASSVTATKIASDAVTTAKILDDAVTTAKILDANVTTGKLATNAVTTVKITDANVTTAKLADGAVTRAKLDSLGQQTSSSCGAYSTSSSSFGTVTNLSVSLTCSGTRPVMLIVQPDTSTNVSFMGNSGGGTSGFIYQFTQDGSSLGVATAQTQGVATQVGVSVIQVIPTPSAGSHTYAFQAKSQSGNIFCDYFILLAFEL